MNERDDIISAACEGLDKEQHDIYPNYSYAKNTSVRGLFPDIIITQKDDKRVKFIIKVETADNISENEVEQWEEYSDLGGTFYLLVPSNLQLKAELLCLQNGIKARFGTYKENSDGEYVISYD